MLVTKDCTVEDSNFGFFLGKNSKGPFSKELLRKPFKDTKGIFLDESSRHVCWFCLG